MRSAESRDLAVGTETSRPGAALALRGVGAALALVGVISYLLWLAGAGIGTAAVGWDFRAYYAAASVIWQGANLYELGSPTVPFYLYPPTLAALLTPLAALKLTYASAVWMLLQHVFLLISGWLIVRLAVIAGGVREGGAAFLGGLLVFLWGTGLPLRQEVYLGQVNSLVLLLSVGGMYLALTGDEGKVWRGALAGLLLALAISIKVFPVLLLGLLLLRGRWRAIAWTVGIFLALQIGVGMATIRPDGYSSTNDYWFSLFPDLPGRPQQYIDNQSFNGWLSRIMLPTDEIPSAALTAWRLTNFAISAIMGLLTVAVLIFSTTDGHILEGALQPATATRRNWPLEVGLLFTLINIVSSISWTHHMIWWVLSALALVARWMTVGLKRWPGYLGLALIAVLLMVSATAWQELGASAGPLSPVFSGAHLLAMLLLWLILARELLRSVEYPLNASFAV